MTGYALEEILGRSLHFLRGPETNTIVLEELRVALDHRMAFHCELLNYRKDGTTIWVELSVVPVPGHSDQDQLSHWVMIQRDITDRKRAEAEALRNQHALAEAQRLAHLGSWEHEPAAKEFIASNEFYSIFGLHNDEPYPIDTIRALIHPDDQQRFNTFVGNLADKHAGYQESIHYRIIRKSGEVRFILEQISVVASRGNPHNFRYIGVTQDVTEREQSQQQLFQAQKMELIGRMAGGIAHDFNNMLTGLIGHLELIQLSPNDPNQHRLETIRTAALRATRISKNLLGLARKSELRKQQVLLEPLINEVIELLRGSIDRKIQIRTLYDTNCAVYGDSTFLNQVLLNLCVNACDAMQTGGTLSIELHDLNYRNLAPPFRLGEFVCVVVKDSGQGIAPEHYDVIFEPFFTTKPIDKGTGLGLAMVRSIIAQHEGWVEFESQIGLGTTFRVYLPKAELLDTAKTPSPRRLPMIRDMNRTDHPRHILVVDDEPVIRELAKSVLEMHGYKITCAEDGHEAIHTLQEHPATIDLVLLDLTMPGISGQETFRELKHIQHDIKVLYSSGYSSEDRDVSDGAIGLLSKPYRPQELVLAVQEALQGKELQRNSGSILFPAER
jgi:PAS domain S-box-containing protein